MTIKARIEDDIVVEIFDSGEAVFPPFHPTLIWVDCPSETQIGWSYSNSNFAPPPADTLAQLWAERQRNALALLQNNDVIAIRCVKAGVPYPTEWLSYDVALREIVHAETGDPKVPLPSAPINKPAGT